MGPKLQEKALRSCSALSNFAIVRAGEPVAVSAGILQEALRGSRSTRQSGHDLTGHDLTGRGQGSGENASKWRDRVI